MAKLDILQKLTWAIALLAACATPVMGAPSLDSVRHALAGTWQSIDDTRLERELDPDGTATDRYEGDSSAAHGRWLVFQSDAPPPEAKGHKLSPGDYYLEIQENGDVLLFVLKELSSQSLSLVYLERGNTISFTRLK